MSERRRLPRASCTIAASVVAGEPPTARRAELVDVSETGVFLRTAMVVKEGDRLTLGDTTLILHNTPGHTPGVLSFELTLFDNGTPHRAYYSGGGGGRGGIAGFEAAVDSAARVLQLENIEVGLTGHSWLGGGNYPNGGIFERAADLAERGPNDPHPFVDAESWELWANAGYERNLSGLEEARREVAGGQ